jgi:tetrahydromethanopterin S-methyltransferase subunit G
MIELNDLSRQNDELITSKDSDLILIRDLGNQLKEYKRKYEQAKTELRSVKGKKIGLDILPHVELSVFLFIHSFISHLSTFLPSNAQI